MTSTERVRKWRADNPERWLALCRNAMKRYHRKHPGRLAENVQRWREKHPGESSRIARRWQINNPKKTKEIRRAGEHKRRARKLGNGGSYTPSEWLALKKFYGNRCLECHKTERALRRLGRTLTPDHVHALSQGGHNDISNIQPLCHGRGGCNNRKGTKHIDFRKTYLKKGVGK